ncbi:MAG: dTDP-4-dehydrorhamnose reductase [Gemmataceae bacterium]|nr:dTDP-4-dehydrorhamnose reductase [Gemmataceae bacterium]
MTTLILGSTGQLGCAMRRLLPDALGWTRQQADLARPQTLRAAVEAARPAVVVNCAAYNAVDQAEKDVEGAFAVNAFAIRELALACRALDATLVHVSTNYVFGQDQSRRMPYEETDAPGPISAYAISKLAGEYFAQSFCPKHLVVRTTGLFGFPDRGGQPGNFVEKLIERARRGDKLRVVNDQELTPTAAADLAQAIVDLLRAGATGLYHFTNAGVCTWHQFACEALRLAGIDVEVEAVTSAAFAAPARRPGYSVLACARYDGHNLPSRRSWQAALGEYMAKRAPR